MKKSVGFGIVAILIILLIGISGCFKSGLDYPATTEAEVSLNQRQKDILEEAGLPTEYTELSTSQQNAIVEIDSMLSYVEEKYNTSFSYAGYVAPSFLEEEHMRAFPTSGIEKIDSFTITKTDSGYEDDYINVAANDLFVSYVHDGIKTMLPNTEIKVYAEITSTSLSEVPTEDTDFDGEIGSAIWVFIDNSTFDEDDLSMFKTDFAEYRKSHELYGVTELVLLKDGEIDNVTRYNFTDYLAEEHYVDEERMYENR